MQIPKTTVSTYISGLESLNLDLEDGTGFDWHFHNFWGNESRQIKLYGKGTDVDTNHIYGYYGIADRSRRLALNHIVSVDPIYIANHHRAALDSLYEYLTKYNTIGYVKGCVEDYFYREEEAKKLFRQILRMRIYLDEERREILDEWLAREFRKWYKSWSRPNDPGTIQIATDSRNAHGINNIESEYFWGEFCT